MICLPLKKNCNHLKFFLGSNFSPLNNIISPFKQKENVQQKEFYSSDFFETNFLALNSQFQNYIFYMHKNDLFLELKWIGNLAEKLVKT